jgi:hypothetical protein
MKSYHLVNSQIVCFPKYCGGLGVLKLTTMHKNHLCKWLWKLENSECTWQRLAESYQKGLERRPTVSCIFVVTIKLRIDSCLHVFYQAFCGRSYYVIWSIWLDHLKVLTNLLKTWFIHLLISNENWFSMGERQCPGQFGKPQVMLGSNNDLSWSRYSDI